MLSPFVQPSFIGLKSLCLRLQSFPEERRLAWGARLHLRARLAGELQRSVSEDGRRFQSAPLLLQPGSDLSNPFAAVSISHCPALSGFALSFDKNIFLGLDLEKASRLKMRTLARVSSEEEVQSAPATLPALLWTAKEAAFKCASGADKSFALLREIFVSKWRKTKGNVWLFRFRAKAGAAAPAEAGIEAGRRPAAAGLRVRPDRIQPIACPAPNPALPPFLTKQKPPLFLPKEQSAPQGSRHEGELLPEGLGVAFFLKKQQYAAAIAALAFKSKYAMVRA